MSVSQDVLAAPRDMLDVLTSLFLLEYFSVEDHAEETTFVELGGRIQRS